MRRTLAGDDVLEHASILQNLLKSALGVFEIERRRPVDRLILGNTARGAVTVDQVLIGRGSAEAWAVLVLATREGRCRVGDDD